MYQERFGNTGYSPPSRYQDDYGYNDYHENHRYAQNQGYRSHQGGGYRNNHYKQQQPQQHSEHGDGARSEFFEQLYNHFGNKSRNARNMPPPPQEPIMEYGQRPEVCSSSDLLRMNIHHQQPSPQRYHDNGQYGNNRSYRGNYHNQDEYEQQNYHQQYNNNNNNNSNNSSSASYRSDPTNVADRLSQALFQGAGPRAGDESNNLHALCMRISQHLKEDPANPTKSEKGDHRAGEKTEAAHDGKSKDSGEMPSREDCVKAAREIVAMLSAPSNEVEFPTSVTLPNVKLRELTNHIPNSHSTTEDLSMPHSYSDDFIARFSALSLFAQQPGAQQSSANQQAQVVTKQVQQQQKKGDSSAEGSEAGEETGEDEEGEEAGATKTGKKRHRKRRKQAKPPCGHDDYKRLRYKHGVTHFLCRACGTKWKQKGFSGEVLQVTPPSADGGI